MLDRLGDHGDDSRCGRSGFVRDPAMDFVGDDDWVNIGLVLHLQPGRTWRCRGMDIAIIGAGTVGENMGIGLLRAGHEVVWSSRQPGSEKARAVLDRAGGGRVASVEETLASSDVVILAVSGDQTLDVAARLDDWTGKVVVDATNVLGPTDGSPTEAFAAAARGAEVARAFNTIGAEHYLDPVFSGTAASMFLCGNTERARSVAGELAEDLGFVAVDIGDLSNSDILDGLARLWVGLVRAGRDRDFAITVLEK